MLNVKLVRTNEKVVIPTYAKPGDSGVDLRAFLPDGPVVIPPDQTRLIPTGIKIAIPEGYEGQVRPRSGTSLKTFLRVSNSPGTIDSSYRGEISIICTNIFSQSPDVETSIAKSITINDGDRIAQLVFCPVIKAEFEDVKDLDSTERGEGGFGHTGVK
jgi:dUTP pyrophosphatase